MFEDNLPEKDVLRRVETQLYDIERALRDVKSEIRRIERNRWSNKIKVLLPDLPFIILYVVILTTLLAAVYVMLTGHPAIDLQ